MEIIEAKCADGIVTINNKAVYDISLISQGKAESSGFILFEKEKLLYITNTISDLQKLIDNLMALAKSFIDAASLGIANTTGGPTNQSGPVTIDPALKASLEKAVSDAQNLKDNLK